VLAFGNAFVWGVFYKKHYPTGSVPPVDFAKKSVIVVLAGEAYRSVAWAMKVESVIRLTGLSKAVVTVREFPPSPLILAPVVQTNPYHFLAVDGKVSLPKLQWVVTI
jgi:hypothetical protein